MQLQSIKISNLLSFKYIAPEEDFHGVQFFTNNTWNINILIGPNGSGKSNFLEIINQIFKVWLFKDFSYSSKNIINPHIDNTSVITQLTNTYKNLTPHVDFHDHPSDVYLTIKLNKNDFENIHFVCSHEDIINNIIKKYSTLDIHFETLDIEKLLKITTLSLHFTIDNAHKTIQLERNNLAPEAQFLYNYIEYFELIQKCMEIYNLFEKLPEERKRYPLKNTFALIGSYRNFSHLDTMINVHLEDQQSIEQLGLKEDTKTQSYKPFWFEAAKQKIVSEYSLATGTYETFSLEEIKNSELFKLLSNFTKEYLAADLYVETKDEGFHFWLQDEHGNIMSFNNLSSWEKSLLMIIFSIYGYDLEDGLMIIDEPELHLHPQLQKQFIQLLETISKQEWIQFIIATHSPVMVNEQNIKSVYRFYRKHNFTHIVSPNVFFVDQEANLIQMLKYGHTSKIFFVDKIVMCEWDTDEYFFNHYLHRLSLQPGRTNRIKNYEIININGKGSYKMWKKFLSKFGLQSYFIGDWDNIKEEGMELDIDSLRHEAYHYFAPAHHRDFHTKTAKYKLIVQYIHEKLPQLDTQINKKIESLYPQGIFILKKGDIETYMGLDVKGLDPTIRFCHHDFESWLLNKEFDEQRNDLNTIFEGIFL